MPSTLNSTWCDGVGVVQGMIGRRIPPPVVRIVEINGLAGTSRVTISGQSGVRRFCCELTFEVVCNPRLVTDDDLPQRVGQRVIEGPGRERRADHEHVRPLSKNSDTAGASGRNLAMPDRVERLFRAKRRTTSSDPRRRCLAMSSTASRVSASPSGDGPGTSPGRQGHADEQAAERVECRVRRGVSRRKRQGFQEPGRPEAAGTADEIDPGRQEAFGARSEASMPTALECLSQASTACRPGEVFHLGEQPVVLGMTPVGLRPVEHPLQIRHHLERSRRCPPGFPP